MSGLSAALLLAMRGWKVDVLERHVKPGGMVARFRRKGVPYETGFHYCGGVADQDILGRCLVHLGIRDRLQFAPLDPDGFDRLIFPDFEFLVPYGTEAYAARLKEAFPHEAAGIDGFLEDIRSAVSVYGIYSFNMETDLQAVLHWESLSLAEVLDERVHDPRLKAVLSAHCPLYGVPPHRAPFGMHAVVLDHFLQGANKLVGGGDALSAALVERLLELGGTVRTRAEVQRVLIENRQALGVELKSGEQLLADFVIASVHPRLVLQMLPEGSVRPAYRNRVLGQKVGQGHFGVFIELDGPPRGVGNRNIYRMTSTDMSRVFDDVQADHVPFYFAAVPPPSPRPDGSQAHTLLMTMGLRWETVEQWADSMPGRRPDDYKAFKEARAKAAIDALCADFPELRSQIVRVHTSTPLTTQFFTNSPEGAMYGHYHGVEQMGKYRLPQFIKVRNFVQVGQSVFTPGVLGAMLSAYYGCGQILGVSELTSELVSA